jgi:apolipoprotein N-acyltransferase
MDVGGTIRAYKKMHPVPIAESIPLGGARPDWLVEVVAGAAPVALRYGDVNLTPIICYDALLADFVRDAVERTAGAAIIHLTNDAWYGQTAKHLHLSTSRLRAIENRRYVIRAATTGYSAIIDSAGRVVQRLPINTAATLVGAVHWERRHPPYYFVGNGPWIVVLALLATLAWRRPRSDAVRDVPVPT